MVSSSEGEAVASPPRRRLSTDQRRQELIDAAIQLLGDEPTAGFSMDEVARRAGASRALLYHYFASKQELIRAVVAHESAALGAALEDTDLPDALDAYLAYVDAHPHGYRLLHGGTLLADPEVKTTIEQTRAQIERSVAAHLRITNATELDQLAVRGWTGAVIAVCLEWAGTDQPNRDAVHTLLMQTLPTSTNADRDQGPRQDQENAAD